MTAHSLVSENSVASEACFAEPRFEWERDVAVAISDQALHCVRDLQHLEFSPPEGDALDVAVRAQETIRGTQRRIRALVVHLGMLVEEIA